METTALEAYEQPSYLAMLLQSLWSYIVYPVISRGGQKIYFLRNPSFSWWDFYADHQYQNHFCSTLFLGWYLPFSMFTFFRFLWKMAFLANLRTQKNRLSFENMLKRVAFLESASKSDLKKLGILLFPKKWALSDPP